MAMVIFEDSPSTNTPINAANLNNNFGEIAGKAPTNHASSSNTYGLGSTTNYGHNKVIDDLTKSSYADGESLSAHQGYELNQSLNGKAPTNHASSSNTYGLGSTTNYGHNKVINDLTHSSFANGESLSAYQGYVLNNKFNYSTTETEIGVWEDGKTLYRKVYKITNIEITVGNWITLANVSSLNIDTLVDCRLYNNKKVWSGFLTRINNGNLQVINGMRDGMSWPCSEFIIEYTKS